MNEELESQFCEHIDFATQNNLRWEEMKEKMSQKSDIDLETAYQNTKRFLTSKGIRTDRDAQMAMLCAAIDEVMSNRIQNEIFNA